MKTILFPTDFSDAASNALQMAKNIAKKSNATLHLCHFYSLALNNYTSPESIIPMDLLDEIKKSATEQINQLKNILANENIAVETTVCSGDLVSEILDLSIQINADIIIMGTTGASNLINKLIGSNALSVMQRSKCPIILVPSTYKSKNSINKIVFADHFDVDNTQVLKALAQLAETLAIPSIDILRVNTENHFDVVKDNTTIDKLLQILGTDKAKLNFVQATNFSEGFKQYATTNEVDLLIMSTRKKSLLERLFAESQTKIMAEYGTVPLMVYHV